MSGVARQVVPDVIQTTSAPVVPAVTRAGDTLRILASDISSVRYWFEKMPQVPTKPQVPADMVTGAVFTISPDAARKLASELPPEGSPPKGSTPAAGA
jgi:hypothetical protein